MYGFVDNNPIDSFDINGRSTLHGAAGQAIVAAFRTGNLTSLRNLARLGKDQRVCDALKTLESTARTLISKSRGGRVNREFLVSIMRRRIIKSLKKQMQVAQQQKSVKTYPRFKI